MTEVELIAELVSRMKDPDPMPEQHADNVRQLLIALGERALEQMKKTGASR